MERVMKYTLEQINRVTDSREFDVAELNLDRSDNSFDGVADIDFIYDDRTPTSGRVVITYY